MPIDIYDEEFQNWLKGVCGLNTTRIASLEFISDKLSDYLKDIPQVELRQFFICLETNKISRLKKQRKCATQWECKHNSCRTLMDRFIDNHIHKDVLKYNWNRKTSVNPEITDLGNEEMDMKWKVIKLYMYIEKDEAADNYTSLETLDISHIIKLMRCWKLFCPDGSAEPYDEVLKSRNELMHSPNNKIKEEEIQNILKWTRKFLDCLHIAHKSYYKNAMQELQELAETEFVVKCKSKQCTKILDNVLKAKDMAEKLYNDIEDENHLCKSQSKELLGMLERSTSKMKPAEYKKVVKEILEKKQQTIIFDKAEYDEDSQIYKELEELEQNAKQDLEVVEVKPNQAKKY